MVHSSPIVRKMRCPGEHGAPTFTGLQLNAGQGEHPTLGPVPVRRSVKPERQWMFREPLFPAVRGARPGARRLEIRDDTVRGRSRDTTIDDAEAMTIPEARTRARGLLAAASGLPKNTDQRQRRALTPGVGSLPRVRNCTHGASFRAVRRMLRAGLGNRRARLSSPNDRKGSRGHRTPPFPMTGPGPPLSLFPPARNPWSQRGKQYDLCQTVLHAPSRCCCLATRPIAVATIRPVVSAPMPSTSRSGMNSTMAIPAISAFAAIPSSNSITSQ